MSDQIKNPSPMDGEEKPAKKWTFADAKRLQKLTRKIIKANGGDDSIIHRMAYECQVKVRKSGQNAETIQREDED